MLPLSIRLAKNINPRLRFILLQKANKSKSQSPGDTTAGMLLSIYYLFAAFCLLNYCHSFLSVFRMMEGRQSQENKETW